MQKEWKSKEKFSEIYHVKQYNEKSKIMRKYEYFLGRERSNHFY